MHQTYTQQPAERVYMHPMVIAGDELWSDYEVETKSRPKSTMTALSGIVFRYRNDRRTTSLASLGSGRS
jgi:hypothetical protein